MRCISDVGRTMLNVVGIPGRIKDNVKARASGSHTETVLYK
jgi:hypothetical protein